MLRGLVCRRRKSSATLHLNVPPIYYTCDITGGLSHVITEPKENLKKRKIAQDLFPVLEIGSKSSTFALVRLVDAVSESVSLAERNDHRLLLRLANDSRFNQLLRLSVNPVCLGLSRVRRGDPRVSLSCGSFQPVGAAAQLAELLPELLSNNVSCSDKKKKTQLGGCLAVDF